MQPEKQNVEFAISTYFLAVSIVVSYNHNISFTIIILMGAAGAIYEELCAGHSQFPKRGLIWGDVAEKNEIFQVL